MATDLKYLHEKNYFAICTSVQRDCSYSGNQRRRTSFLDLNARSALNPVVLEGIDLKALQAEDAKR